MKNYSKLLLATLLLIPMVSLGMEGASEKEERAVDPWVVQQVLDREIEIIKVLFGESKRIFKEGCGSEPQKPRSLFLSFKMLGKNKIWRILEASILGNLEGKHRGRFLSALLYYNKVKGSKELDNGIKALVFYTKEEAIDLARGLAGEDNERIKKIILDRSYYVPNQEENALLHRFSQLFHYYLSFRKLEIINFLLDHGTDPNKVYTFDFYGVAQEFLSYEPKIVQILVDHGLNVNVPDIEGNTILHFCAQGLLNAENGQDLTMKFLIDHGADVLIKNKKGETAGDLAEMNEQGRSTIDFLREKEAEARGKQTI